MKLFDRLKEWMGIRRLLRDLPQDRKPVARSIAVARKVAIVYVVEDETAHNHVRNYVRRIKEELGITNIMALGYSDGEAVAVVKQLPEGLAVAEGIRQALKLLAKG